MSVYLIVAIPITDRPDPETAVGIARKIARIGGTKAPWQQFTDNAVLYDVYSLTLKGKLRVDDLKTAFPNMSIICRWRRVDGMQNTTDRMKKALYLKAMPDDVDAEGVRTRPTVVRQMVRPHDNNPDLDMSET